MCLRRPSPLFLCQSLRHNVCCKTTLFPKATSTTAGRQTSEQGGFYAVQNQVIKDLLIKCTVFGFHLVEGFLGGRYVRMGWSPRVNRADFNYGLHVITSFYLKRCMCFRWYKRNAIIPHPKVATIY
uniref:Uncharacterized protein n=1 Tax=Micrurus spixii TaxID=129469 RepID=A0A2D4LFL3_9SAUR